LQEFGIEFLELREYNLGVIVLVSLLSSSCRSVVAVPVLKSSLGKGFHWRPVQVGDLVGRRSCGLRIRVQGMTTASGVCEFYCFVTSFVF
jgi:hypothetical protein